MRFPLLLVLAFLGVAGGCAAPRPQTGSASVLQPMRLMDFAPLPPGPIELSSAKNEWVSFGLQLRADAADLPQYSLRLRTSADAANHPLNLANVRVFQVLSLPMDVNRAAYVRHTGASAEQVDLPQALLPLPAGKGRIPLSSLRPAGGTVMLWFDVQVAADTPAGEYPGLIELQRGGGSIAAIPVTLRVWDFALPAERNLKLIGSADWDALVRLYPQHFEGIAPRLLNRQDPRYAGAVRTLDEVVELARTHRLELVVPRLQPTVKWPAAQPPTVDWSDFDSLVAPWMKAGASFWPLPAIDSLERFDEQSQLEYFAAAATHFDQMDWLDRSAVLLPEMLPMVRHILSVHPDLRVLVGTAEQDLAHDGEQWITRLIAAAPPLVSPPLRRPRGADVPTPQRWLRTDQPELVVYQGPGADERDVRLWAWLAFLRDARFVLWNNVLPAVNRPDEPQNPASLVWFYPGSWFGVDQPLPSVQLKWLRRAQQDYEYLHLARQRGEVLNALLMARLITKPVELAPQQPPDPMYSMLSGTADPQAWTDVRQLLAELILLRQEGGAPDATRQQELNLRTLRWMQPQERPLLVGQTTRWHVDEQNKNELVLQVGVDIYNASDSTPDQNQLQWAQVPGGWQVRPQPTSIPPLATYRVQRYLMSARVNMQQIDAASRQPAELRFINGFTRRESPLQLYIPAAVAHRRTTPLELDGSLGDWSSADAIHDGPLVRMLDRPGVQNQAPRLADQPTSLYSAYSDDQLYLSFKAQGRWTAGVRSARNFVDYQLGRAWGEDLCQLLVQAIYDDNTVGPIIHLVCKPNGQWVEKRSADESWRPVEGSAVRYASTIDAGVWRGEVAIPWRLLMEQRRGLPKILRFNFAQHEASSGASASWAGPVDFGRDEQFTGLLVLQ